MNIFLDLDDVLADFSPTFIKHFGAPIETFAKKEKWRLLHGVPDFFYNIPPICDGLKLYEYLVNQGESPIILTACPASRYEQVARQKIDWVHRHIGENVLVLPAYGSESKAAYVQHEGDLLIDDYGKNCAAWVAAGGEAIQYKDFYQTMTEYNRLSCADEERRRA